MRITMKIKKVVSILSLFFLYLSLGACGPGGGDSGVIDDTSSNDGMDYSFMTASPENAASVLAALMTIEQMLEQAQSQLQQIHP